MGGLSLQASLTKSARSNADLGNCSTMLDGSHPRWSSLPNRCFFFIIKRVVTIPDFLKASAAAALQRCESCCQKTSMVFLENSECAAKIFQEP